ncbi:MAG TPA: hypothetical protein VNZ49_05320 [Bacteroidia bacterium]|jgi:hypothetical protein|nr:hypothetical protein [Bacteroidia bacterium]
MKKIFFLATASIVCSGLLFTSCKKKETEDNDTTAAADHALGETCSNDISNIGTQASYGNMTTYKLGMPDQIYTSCATITFDSLNHADPDSIKVDFGTGCTGLDNRTRKGVLLFIHTPGLHYRDSGNVISVSTPGNTYYVDNNQIIINNKTITNKGHVTNGMLTWLITSNIQINRSNGNVITWSTNNRTKVLLAGEMPNHQPIDWPHARVAIYGDASGTHTKSGGNSQSFSAHVSQASWLVRDFNCGLFRRFFVSGILEFTPGSKPTRYVNFGTGNCDDQAVVTINGHTYNITLH